MKGYNWGWIILAFLLVGVLFFLVIIVEGNKNEKEKFCISQGYENYEWVESKGNFCYLIKDAKLYEADFSEVNGQYYLIENEK